MAAELGTTKNTARRWLRRDPWDVADIEAATG
jgi:hypothetical protein